MTTVRVAHAEPHFDTRLDGSGAIRHILVVLADDPGHRAIGLWLRTRHGMALHRVLEHQSAGGGRDRAAAIAPWPDICRSASSARRTWLSGCWPRPAAR